MENQKAEMLQQIIRFQQGDADAFSWIFETYYSEAFRMAWLISGNYADSEDIVQETFTACYYHREQLKNPESFKSWFYKILTRAAWKQCKKQRKETPCEEIQQGEEKSDFGSLEPLENFLRREQDNRIYRAVLALPIKQRTVIVLYYFNELSVREIAKVLQSLEGTVKSRLHNGRKNLKELLKDEDMEQFVEERRTRVL